MTLTELKFNGEGKSQFMFSQFELEFLQAIAVPEAQIETLSLGRAAVGRPLLLARAGAQFQMCRGFGPRQQPDFPLVLQTKAIRRFVIT